MSIVKRGEVWWSDLARTAGEGHVLTDPHGVLVISHDECNRMRDRFTLVPIKSAVKDGIHRRPGEYGVLVQRDEVESVRGGLDGASLVLCDNIYTFFGEPSATSPVCDIDQARGVRVRLSSSTMARICERLKGIFANAPSSSIGRFRNRFRQGDVLTTGVGGLEDEPKPWLLVVSSNHFNADHRWPLVILIPFRSEIHEELPLGPIVDVTHIATGSNRRLPVGCQDIFVQDTRKWRFKKIGHVADLTAVRIAIHHYLGIVMAKKKDEQGPPALSEADLAKSAEADRDASNQFGLAFRERQLQTFRDLVEREDREEGQTVPTSFLELMQHGVPGWEIIGGAVRRTFELRPGQLRLATEGAAVLGSPTQTFECDLMPLLEELGIASEFDAFKLVCLIENVTKVGAVLMPRQKKGKVEHHIEVALHLSRSVLRGKGKRAVLEQETLAAIRFRPYSSPGSELYSVNIENPNIFSGQLEIRIREVDDAETRETVAE